MDKLEILFDMQKALNDDIVKRRGLDGIDDEKWIQMHVLAMLSEMAELLNEVNFKWWKNPVSVNRDNVKDEIVDMLHFLLSMCIKSGMDAGELFERYRAKNKENFDRQMGLSSKPGYKAGE
ncbi:MAG: dUTPase [Clostridia bacterium]|nr:dUTPase [Clostridia bacterium]